MTRVGDVEERQVWGGKVGYTTEKNTPEEKKINRKSVRKSGGC